MYRVPRVTVFDIKDCQIKTYILFHWTFIDFLSGSQQGISSSTLWVETQRTEGDIRW